MSDPGKYACDLKPGDVVFVNGIPTDIRSIEREGAWVNASFSDHHKDTYRWLSFTWVPVVAHVDPGYVL